MTHVFPRLRSRHSGHKRRRCGRYILEGCWECLDTLVVASQTVDTAFAENEPKLRILILAIAIEMLANRHSLLDEMIEIFGDIRRKTIFLQDPQDLNSSDCMHLWNSEAVSQGHTYLRGSKALLCKFANVVSD